MRNNIEKQQIDSGIKDYAVEKTERDSEGKIEQENKEYVAKLFKQHNGLKSRIEYRLVGEMRAVADAIESGNYLSSHVIHNPEWFSNLLKCVEVLEKTMPIGHREFDTSIYEDENDKNIGYAANLFYRTGNNPRFEQRTVENGSELLPLPDEEYIRHAIKDKESGKLREFRVGDVYCELQDAILVSQGGQTIGPIIDVPENWGEKDGDFYPPKLE